MLLKFLRNRRGSVLPIFAIALIPLLVATGGIVDYTNAFDQRSLVQNSLDAAALAAGKQIGLMTTEEVEAEAESFFLANVGVDKISNIPELTTAINGSTVDVNTTLHVPTYFLGMIGLDEFVFNLHAQVTVAMGTLEVAMALDNSGSMSGSRIETLRTAAANLATTLHNLAATSTKPEPIKIGLAPFAAAVNVGPGNAGAAWMDTGAMGTYHADAQKCYAAGGAPNSSGTCVGAGTITPINNFTLFNSLKYSDGTSIPWGGCVEERPFPYDVSDDPPSDAVNPTTEQRKTLFVPMFAADDPDPWTCTTSICESEGTINSNRRYKGAPAGGRNYNNYLPDTGDAMTCGNIFTVTSANPAVFTSSGHGLTAGTEMTLTTTGSLYTGISAGPTYTVAATGLTANNFQLLRSANFTVTSADPAVFTSSSHGLLAGSEVTISTTGSLYTGLTAGEAYTVSSAGLTTNSFRLLGNTNFTVNSANPAVFTKTAHGLTAGTELVFSTTGSLYTGLTAGTTYYVAASGLATNTFRVTPVSTSPTFTVTRASPAVFTSNGHGMTAGTPVVFSTTGALYTGLTAGTTYYVISTGLTTNAFRVSTSVGGSAVNTSGSQSGTHRFTPLVRTSGSQSGTHSYASLVKTSGSQSGTHSFTTLVRTSGTQSGVHRYYADTPSNWTCQSGNAGCGGTNNGKSFEQAFGGLNIASAPHCKYGTPDNKATIASITVGGIQAGPNFMCSTTPLTPLTTSLADITTAINAQDAVGATNITAGLMWGWRVLSPGEPFIGARPYSDNENQKILILMTDGANTYYPHTGSGQTITKGWYGAWGYVAMGHLGSTSTTSSTLVNIMNQRTALACQNVKAAGIRIYTIAFDISDTDTVNMMNACATEPSMAFQSNNESDLLAAFNAIGDDISLLRIAQ